ncbi:MAG: right-handed parallel beta-helix repeat-containing protein [Burkholderiales bacterium]|nr:right-handed parallel beta-helix repeat-containing protein [Opitutaceae bacterium]
MNVFFFRRAAPVLALITLVPALAFAQGALTPPGAPAPTMKTLQQVEPRIDLATLPGTAAAVISITQSGSYYASGNIGGSTGKHTIVVAATNVTIDLNGFTLSVTGTANAGVFVSASANVTVRNGRIFGGSHGVQGTARLVCTDLHIENSAGILALGDSVVERCRLFVAGIQLGARGVVNDCYTSSSFGVSVGAGGIVQRTQVITGGISTGADGQVVECTVSTAPASGILTGLRGIVRNCQVNGAANSGIRVGDQSVLSHCTVNAAGAGTPISTDGGFSLGAGSVAEKCVASQGGVAGFVGGSAVRLSDCVASGNSGLGFSVGTRSVLSGCIATLNGAGGIYSTGSGALIEHCLAAGNTGGAGIRVDNGTVSECEVRENQGGAGIRASTGSTVINNTSNSNGSAAIPQNGFLIEGGRGRVEGNHTYNNTGYGFEVTNTSSTNSVLVISNSAGSNDLGEFFIGAGNAVGPIVSSSNVLTNTIPTANFNL